MSTYKPPNSTIFLYDFQLKGCRFYGSTGQKTKRAADRIEAEKRLEAASNVKRKTPITLDDAAALYEDKLKKNERWSKSTEVWIMGLITALGPNRYIHDIQQPELGKHFAARCSATITESGRRQF